MQVSIIHWEVAYRLLSGNNVNNVEWPWTAKQPPTRAISALAELLVLLMLSICSGGLRLGFSLMKVGGHCSESRSGGKNLQQTSTCLQQLHCQQPNNEHAIHRFVPVSYRLYIPTKWEIRSDENNVIKRWNKNRKIQRANGSLILPFGIVYWKSIHQSTSGSVTVKTKIIIILN